MSRRYPHIDLQVDLHGGFLHLKGADGHLTILGLDRDDIDELYAQVRDARLVHLGMHSVEVRADQVIEGDVIESLGSSVNFVTTNTVFGIAATRMRFNTSSAGSEGLMLPAGQLIRVNRPIH